MGVGGAKDMDLMGKTTVERSAPKEDMARQEWKKLNSLFNTVHNMYIYAS